jgi:excisionase family DNA binding protein
MEPSFENLPQAVNELSERLKSIENILNSKDHTPQSEADQLLTIEQAANFLNLSVPTLYGYVHKAEIPFSKPAKRLYFSKQELINWIKSGRRKTNTEIEREASNYVQKRKEGNV